MGQPPIIVRIVEPAGDPTGLGAVLVGALGLAGALALVAVVAAAVMGAVLFWIRSRPSGDDPSHP